MPFVVNLDKETDPVEFLETVIEKKLKEEVSVYDWQIYLLEENGSKKMKEIIQMDDVQLKDYLEFTKELT